MKYQHKETGKIIDVLEENKKFRTVLIELEDGTTQNITTSTLKRWYRKLDMESEYVAEVMEQKKELGIEVPKLDPKDVKIVDDVSSDGTPYSQVMTEIQKDAKALKTYITLNKIIDYIEDVAYLRGMSFYAKVEHPNIRFYRFMSGKHVIFNVQRKKNKVVMFIKSKLLPENLDIVKSMKTVSYYLDKQYDVLDLTPTTKHDIETIINSIRK